MTDEAREATGAPGSEGVPLSDRAAWLLFLLPLTFFLWTGVLLITRHRLLYKLNNTLC